MLTRQHLIKTETFNKKKQLIGCRAVLKLKKKKIQGVHKVSLQLKKLLQSEMMRYRNEGCFMLISIS